MKWGFRKPSIRKRVAARLSWKRYVRNSLGLSAPNKFAAAATTKGVSVTPEVTVRMGYSDWRWFALVAFVVLSISWRVVKRARGRQSPVEAKG